MQDVRFTGRLAGMLNHVRKLPEMRISGSLTGVSGLGAMTATDLGAPLMACWVLTGLTFFFFTLLVITTIRPRWVAYIAGEMSGFLDRLSHRAAPPHAT
jgi:fucose 4-O-acetylase-like acetyltransferase